MMRSGGGSLIHGEEASRLAASAPRVPRAPRRVHTSIPCQDRESRDGSAARLSAAAWRPPSTLPGGVTHCSAHGTPPRFSTRDSAVRPC